jgi:integrase
MAAALIPFAPEPQQSVLTRSLSRAEAYARNATAENTRRGYRSDWAGFAAWCEAAGQEALPARPETVACYISELAATHKPATIARHLAAIASAHKARGFPSPASMQHGAVAAVWHGIRRTHGTAQTQKSPLLTADLRRMAGALDEGVMGARDRALLLVGFAGAFRRSELVGLDIEDCEFGRDGLVITLRRSKTDQEAQGRKIGIPYGSNPETCPVRALQAWIEVSGAESGALFRPINRHGQVRGGRLTGTAVALIVKRHAAAAGLAAENFSGHSLRADLATAAAIAGASEPAIMRQTGHRSAAMLRRYVREASLFRENAAAVVGL